MGHSSAVSFVRSFVGSSILPSRNANLNFPLSACPKACLSVCPSSRQFFYSTSWTFLCTLSQSESSNVVVVTAAGSCDLCAFERRNFSVVLLTTGLVPFDNRRACHQHRLVNLLWREPSRRRFRFPSSPENAFVRVRKSRQRDFSVDLRRFRLV